MGSKIAVLITGLSASGKTTLAQNLQDHLRQTGRTCACIDGDQFRTGTSKDLGFSRPDRIENLRRIAHTANTFTDDVVLIASIAPYEACRQTLRATLESNTNLLIVHLTTSLAVCEQRDPKGLYARARSGEIENFTGVSSPYESPENPALALNTETQSVDECLAELVTLLG